MEYKNSRQIIDAIENHKAVIKELQEKANKCGKENFEIGKIQNECLDIFQMVMKNFSSTRIELGIYFLNNWYVNESKEKKIVIGEENIPKNNRYHYEELCLHNTGFSLLSEGGIKSSSILEKGNDNFIRNLVRIKDKSVQKIVKEKLREEKFEILQKILNGIEVLDYEKFILKTKNLKYNDCDFSTDAFNIKVLKYENLKFNAEGATIKCIFLKNKEETYSDIYINPSDLNYEAVMIIEQSQEELLNGLDEFYIYLNEKKNKMKEYLTQIKTDFTKELIVMALNNQNENNIKL